ncbi:MAG: GNAT family N-acetyltransferase, partial [Ilumatobacteraceae bacterium]
SADLTGSYARVRVRCAHFLIGDELRRDAMSGQCSPVATVRSACFDDVAAMAAIKANGWATTYSGLVPDDVLARFTDVDAHRTTIGAAIGDSFVVVLVATLGDDTVGFGLCRWNDPEGGYLDSLHVLPELRGRGVGLHLLRSIAGELHERGVASLQLHVVEGNAGAGRFYERHGAHLVGSTPAAWATSVTELVYRWSSLRALLGGSID